jgi:hypothetical protein
MSSKYSSSVALYSAMKKFNTWVSTFSSCRGDQLITGYFDSASEFIGLPAAQACVRAGHQVFGLTRSQENLLLKRLSQQLEQLVIPFLTTILTNPVIPVIGEVDKPAGWVHIVKDLDAVFDCVGGTADVKKRSEKKSPGSQHCRQRTASLGFTQTDVFLHFEHLGAR